jgi:CelD/BcsL family acetyltransferase involved in cellulose biosynthesis
MAETTAESAQSYLATSSTEYSIRLLTSIAELREISKDWDTLWQESDSTLPCARADIIALWVDHFASSRQFCALVVEHHGELVGALPLIGRRILGPVSAGSLPGNIWASSGDLLISQRRDSETILRLIAQGLERLPWSLLVLERIPYETDRWMQLRDCLREEGAWSSVVHQHRAALVDIGDDWTAYEASLKGRHRQRRRRNERMLNKSGEVRFRTFGNVALHDVETLMRRGFAVEDRSWKGDAQTSILKNKEAYDYYIAEAETLAESQLLEIAFIELDGEPITFHYGWNSKGVRYSVKIGYDQRFSKFGPGQQQCMQILAHAHQDPHCSLYDFYGRLMPWNEMWATRFYDVGRLVICPRRGPVRALASLYTKIHPTAKNARNRLRRLAERFKRR